MSKVGRQEIRTQKRVIAFFKDDNGVMPEVVQF